MSSLELSGDEGERARERERAFLPNDGERLSFFGEGKKWRASLNAAIDFGGGAGEAVKN